MARDQTTDRLDPQRPAPTSTEVVAGLHRIELGMAGFPVNVYLLDIDGHKLLIDSGYPADADRILGAVGALGVAPATLERVVITHGHLDHLGSAAELRRLTGARLLMTETDSEPVRRGLAGRPMQMIPGMEKLFPPGTDVSRVPAIGPFAPDECLEPGGAVPGVDELRLIAAPGHCAGQVAILWRRHGGVLFVGDAAGNRTALAPPAVAEDFAVAHQTLRSLARREFNVAAFGHGPPILEGASEAFSAEFAGSGSG